MTDHIERAARAALTELDAYLEDLGGCGNAHCIVWNRPGQHTNGGCKCSADRMLMQRFAYAHNRFASAINHILSRGAAP